MEEKARQIILKERTTKLNDGRYKSYVKILRPNKNLDKAAKYFEDPLGFYFHKKGDYLNPKVKHEEHYKRNIEYQIYLKQRDKLIKRLKKEEKLKREKKRQQNKNINLVDESKNNMEPSYNIIINQSIEGSIEGDLNKSMDHAISQHKATNKIISSYEPRFPHENHSLERLKNASESMDLLKIPKKKTKKENARYKGNKTKLEKYKNRIMPHLKSKFKVKYNESLFDTQESTNPYLDLKSSTIMSDYSKKRFLRDKIFPNAKSRNLPPLKGKMASTGERHIREKPLCSLSIFAAGKSDEVRDKVMKLESIVLRAEELKPKQTNRNSNPYKIKGETVLNKSMELMNEVFKSLRELEGTAPHMMEKCYALVHNNPSDFHS